MLVEFEQNRMVQTARNFERFDQKKQKTKKQKQNKNKNKTKQNKTFFLNQFWQRVDAILEDVSVAETIV